MGETEHRLVIKGLSPDDTVLISGPPMTGKYELLLRLLASYSDNLILISTKNDASRIISDYGDIAGEIDRERIGAIDCVSRNEAIDDTQEVPIVRYVKSPQNLTQIGVEFTELSDIFLNRDGHTGVGIHSLSQLVMHSTTKSVYQFLQVLTGQIRSAGWLGVAVIDTSVDTDEELRILHHHFDGVIETREDPDQGRQYRVRGLAPTTTEWDHF